MTHDNDLIRRGDALDAMRIGPRTVQERIDTIRALPAVAASQPADPIINADSCQRVMVKPLVWEGHSDDQRSGDYVIKPSYGQGPKRLLLARGSKLVSWHDDMDEAQRAGQDDHEARILAALDVQPDPRDAQPGPRDAEALFLSWWNANHDFDWQGNGGIYENHAKKFFLAGVAAAKGCDA